MIIGRQLIDNYYEDERLYSTGSDILDEAMERAFSEGYEYAQQRMFMQAQGSNTYMNLADFAKTEEGKAKLKAIKERKEKAEAEKKKVKYDDMNKAQKAEFNAKQNRATRNAVRKAGSSFEENNRRAAGMSRYERLVNSNTGKKLMEDYKAMGKNSAGIMDGVKNAWRSGSNWKRAGMVAAPVAALALPAAGAYMMGRRGKNDED